MVPLSFINPNGIYRLFTDASDIGAGGVLVTYDNLTKQNNIIAFFYQYPYYHLQY